MAVHRIRALLFPLLTGASLIAATVSAPEFAGRREAMVKFQLAFRGVNDARLLAAMRKVPREQFVPEQIRHRSYEDRPLPIGLDQTISQPFIVGLMTQQLRLQPTDRVLEIGTGSGYQAAILAELAAEVYTIEIVEPLGRKAAATLQRLGTRMCTSRSAMAIEAGRSTRPSTLLS